MTKAEQISVLLHHRVGPILSVWLEAKVNAPAAIQKG